MEEYKICTHCQTVFDYVESQRGGYELKQRHRRSKKTWANQMTCPVCHQGTLIETTEECERERNRKEAQKFQQLVEQAKANGESVVGLRDRALHGRAPSLVDRIRGKQ